MRSRRIWLWPVGIVTLVFGWYWFRPELLFIDRTVNEAFPRPAAVESQAAPLRTQDKDSTALARGDFHSVAHDTNGTATIHKLRDGRRVLRLTEFATSNGPDVRVYLIAAADASDSATVSEADFIELGPMKGNMGDQNYDVPADVDLERYRAVTIWCKRFSVNFGTAPLHSVVAAEGAAI